MDGESNNFSVTPEANQSHKSSFAVVLVILLLLLSSGLIYFLFKLQGINKQISNLTIKAESFQQALDNGFLNKQGDRIIGDTNSNSTTLNPDNSTLTANPNQNATVKLGDSSGYTSFVIQNSNGIDVASLNSLGNFGLDGKIICTNCITLGSETTGNYVKSLIAGNDIAIFNGTGEGVSPTIINTSTLNSVMGRGASTNYGLTFNDPSLALSFNSGAGRLYDSLGNLYYNGTNLTAGGGLPVGVSGQTLRNDGLNWLASSLLYNNGTNIGIGDTSPTALLTVGNGDLFQVNSSGAIAAAQGLNVTGTSSLAYNGAGTSLAVTQSGTGNAATIMGGNVGIGTTTPARSLDVVGGLRGNNINFWPKSRPPLVTFEFDDNVTTTYTLIKPLFDAKNIVGVDAVITNSIDHGGLTSAQLQEMSADGWEMSNHTKSHPHLTTLTESQIRAEFIDANTALNALGIKTTTCVYPFEETNTTVQQIAREIFRGCRGSSGINSYPLNSYLIKSNQMDDPTLLATYESLVDAAQTNSQWLMFHMHSADAADVATISALIDYIQAKNISIVTADQALNLVENEIDGGDGFALSSGAGLYVNGNVGIGTNLSPSYRLDVLQTKTVGITTGADPMARFNLTVNNAAAVTNWAPSGLQVTAINTGVGGITNNITGIGGIVTQNGSGTINFAIGLSGQIQNSHATGTITNAYAINAAGPYIASTGTIGTATGLHISAQKVAGVTTGYGLYQAGAADLNYFAGNVGLGTTASTNILSLGGESARTFWMERRTATNTAGNNLTITSGGATSGATDKNGGHLYLTSGLSTGTGSSSIYFQTSPAITTGAIKTTTLNAGGSGYTVGDVLTIVGGGNNATISVATVDGSGVVLTYNLSAAGTGYAIADAYTTTYGGAGTGCKINITALTGTADNSLATAMTVLGNGNVGIGTATPTNLLNIYTNTTGSAVNLLKLQNHGSTAGTGAGILFGNYDYSTANIVASSNPSSSRASTLLITTRNSADTWNAGITIDGSGQVGIGGIPSGALLHISPADQTTAAYGLKFGTDTNFYRSAADTLKTDDSLLIGTKLGIGIASPTNALSLSGQSAQTIWMERQTTANTAGNNLTLQAGGATSGATDKAGGSLYLQGGLSTGNKSSVINLQLPDPTGGIATVTISAAGTLYTAGDILTLGTGTGGQVTISTVDGGGGVTGVTVTAAGTGYRTGSGYATTGGTGSGCKIKVVTITATTDNSYTDGLKIYNATSANSADSRRFTFSSIASTDTAPSLVTLDIYGGSNGSMYMAANTNLRLLAGSSGLVVIGNSGGESTYINNTGVAIGTSTVTSKLNFAAATTAAGGILFGTDTNLYRSAANILSSDDKLDPASLNLQVKAGIPADGDIIGGASSGDIVLDTSDSRIYVREGATWKYAAIAAGFQIPNQEVFSYDFASKSFDISKPIKEGDLLIPFADKTMSDGAMHGLYTTFDSVKQTMFDSFATDFSQLADTYLSKRSDTALTKIDNLEISLSNLSQKVDGLSGNTNFISSLQNALAISTLGDLTTKGALTVTGDATFGGNVSIDKTLKANNIELGQNSKGTAKIVQGNDSIEVKFTNPFNKTPLVSITPQQNPGSSFWLSHIDTEGFTIQLSSPASQDIIFSWFIVQ